MPYIIRREGLREAVGHADAGPGEGQVLGEGRLSVRRGAQAATRGAAGSSRSLE
jgi:hypothetical protein